MHALPVRHRRAGDQAGAEQVGPQHGHHQRLIAGLAVADGERARRVRMEFDHALEELHLSLDDIQELLAGFGRRAEADEIDRMARVQGSPISLSALKPPMPGPWPARGSTTTTGRLRGSVATPGGGMMRESE